MSYAVHVTALPAYTRDQAATCTVEKPLLSPLRHNTKAPKATHSDRIVDNV
jgi:hypothetical protein